MAFTVPSYTTGSADGAGTTGFAINQPAGLQDDDILYASLTISADEHQYFSCAGWTKLADNATTGHEFTSTILRKVISDASSEPASYTFVTQHAQSNKMCGIVFIVRGGDTTTPEDAVTQESTGKNDDTPDSPSITTATNGALTLAFEAIDNAESGTGMTLATPSGYTIIATKTTYFHAMTAVAYAVKTTAGATGAKTWGNTADAGTADYHTYMAAVKPASAAATALPSAQQSYRQRRN